MHHARLSAIVTTVNKETLLKTNLREALLMIDLHGGHVLPLAVIPVGHLQTPFTPVEVACGRHK